MTKTIRTNKWLRAALALVVLLGVLLCAFPMLNSRAFTPEEFTITVNGGNETFTYYPSGQTQKVTSNSYVGSYTNSITLDELLVRIHNQNDDNKIYISALYYDSDKTKRVPDDAVFDSSQTLYATWANDYRIVLDPNGGSIEKEKYSYGEEDNYTKEPIVLYCSPREPIDYYLETSYLQPPEGTDLVFDGWYEDKALTDPLQYGGESFLPLGNMTLYAKWVKASNSSDYCTVTFNCNGMYQWNSKTEKYEASDKVYTNRLKKGDLTYGPDVFQKDAISGYGFEEATWYLDKTGTKKVSGAEYSDYFNFRPEDDVTLYAGKASYRTVTLDPMGGYINSSNEEKTVTFNVWDGKSILDAARQIYSLSSNENNVVFGGWFYDAEYKQAANLNDTIHKNITLYAKWDKPVTITLNSGDENYWSIDAFQETKPKELETNVTPEMPLNVALMYRYYYLVHELNGYYGYSDTISNTSKLYYDAKHTQLVDSGKTYAKNGDVFYPNINYDVTVNLHMGQGGISWGGRAVNRVFSMSVDSSETYKSIMQYFLDEGYGALCTPGETYLEGWYTDAGLTKRFDDSNVRFTKDIDLYAKYTKTKPADKRPGFLNGLVQGPDGKWAMYKNNKVDTSATGIFQNENGWWRVENGYVNFKANGIYQNEYGWWKTTDGKVTFKETGVFQNENGWWRVKDSKVDFKANGIYENKNGWWKTTNGKVTFKETGVFQNENGWWRVKDSKVDFKANGIYQNKNGWWKTTNGKVTFKENGIFQNENGWWVVKDSKVDFSATGLYDHGNEIWKATNGKVTFKETGMFRNNDGDMLYRVKNSKVDTKANGIYQYGNDWYKTTNGEVTFDENGLFKGDNGTFYVRDSKVDFDFTGLASNSSGTYYVENGKVNTKKNGKINLEGQTFTLKSGKVV